VLEKPVAIELIEAAEEALAALTALWDESGAYIREIRERAIPRLRAAIERAKGGTD
jgi:hypothetical protein